MWEAQSDISAWKPGTQHCHEQARVLKPHFSGWKYLASVAVIKGAPHGDLYSRGLDNFGDPDIFANEQLQPFLS